MKKYLFGCLLVVSCLFKESIFAQAPAKIKAAEYFIDIDPGTGNASPIVISTTDSVSLNLTVATNSLTGGFHQLFIRFEDANNFWSIAEQRTFYIDSAVRPAPSKIIAGEYFFDKDPGVGKATKLIITATDSVNKLYSFPATTLKGGFHQLFIRYRDSSNKWGIAEQRAFYVYKDSSLEPSPIIAAEYFFTKDPGVGKGTPITISKADSVNQNFNITVPGLAAGKQFLEIRFKDSTGKWSIAESRQITIVSSLNSNETISAFMQDKLPIMMNVYPNPTSGNAFLSFNGAKEERLSIEIFNTPGKLLVTKEIMSHSGQNKISLDLSGLIPGIYFIKVNSSDQKQQTFKIIKQ